MSQGQDTDRAVVKTFVPAYQKTEWKRHADELDMSQSEFVRTMVQAGRSDFDIETMGSSDTAPEEGGPDGSNPGGDGLETRLLDVLESDPYLSWDELVQRLSGNFEERLQETVKRLQRENRIEHSPIDGGYAVVSDGE